MKFELNYPKLYPNIPFVVNISGRGFSKLTQLMDKPFSETFIKAMIYSMEKLQLEIENTVFSYSFNDEIIFVVKPNQNVWFDGDCQKISSICSSLASIHFYEFSLENNLQISGLPIFGCNTYNVSTTNDILDFLIQKQFDAINISVYNACYYSLIENNTKQKAKSILLNLSLNEQISLLKTQFNIDYTEYSSSYKLGVAAYRVPKIINEETKLKWKINYDLPIFSEEKKYLTEILSK